MPSKSEKKSKSWSWKSCLQNIALMAATLIILLLVLELLMGRVVQMEKPTLAYDPDLGMRGRPNVKTLWTREIENNPRMLKLNQYGFHDVDHTLKKAPGTHRVFFIGDSFLEAYQVPIADNFCKITEAGFKSKSPAPFKKVEHINGGLHTWGLGTYSIYVRKRLDQWHPDTLVVVIYMGNDLLDNYYLTASEAVPQFSLENGRLKQTPPPPYRVKMWLRDNVLARSSLIKFIWLRVIRSSRAGFNLARRQALVGSPNMDFDILTPERIREIATIAELELQDIQKNLEKKHIGLFVYVIPVPRYVNYLAGKKWLGSDLPKKNGPAFLRLNKTLETAVTGYMDQNNIPYVNARETFVKEVRQGRKVYLSETGHLNEHGHRVSAQLIEKPLWDVVSRNP